MENKIIEYFNLCRQSEFPFPEYALDILEKDLNNLLKTDSKFSNSGLKIIYQYHKSIWYGNKKGRKSPYASWYDDANLLQVIANRLKYKSEDLTKQDILNGFTISGTASKVSIFRPALAKYLITKYLNQYDEIFDPCSGFSGRLLGAYACNKRYLGYDINSKTIKESNELINNFDIKNCSVICKNSIAIKGEYECLFTCPPYGDKENWNQEIENLTADDWIDICIKNYDCKSYLFVVDNTEKYKQNIVETILNKSHFSRNEEYVILIKK